MAVTTWLIDKSALSHLDRADDAWLSRIHRGLVRISTVTLLEIGFSTRNGADHRDTLGEPPVSSMPVENLTPAILVESPLYFEEVGNPVRATGTANTFEATLQYELTDTDGRIVDDGFVTATSGSGTRGTFDFTTKEYEIPFDGVGALFVFELSAKDGSRINLREIPVRMAK